jgi:hypothetical protein
VTAEDCLVKILKVIVGVLIVVVIVWLIASACRPKVREVEVPSSTPFPTDTVKPSLTPTVTRTSIPGPTATATTTLVFCTPCSTRQYLFPSRSTPTACPSVWGGVSGP